MAANDRHYQCHIGIEPQRIEQAIQKHVQLI